MLFTQNLSHFFICLVILFFSVNTKSDTITIATGEYPPWTSENMPNGGFINHIVSSAFKVSNINVEFHYMPWKRALEATKVGQFNASSFWAIDKDRQDHFFHSDVIQSDAFVFFHRKSLTSLKWNRLQELKDYRIGATLGYTYNEEFWNLSENNQLRISVMNDDVTNLKRLMAGEIDLFPLSQVTGQYLLQQSFTKQEANNLTFNAQPINSDKVVILLSHAIENNKKYVELFNKGLRQLKKQGRIEAFRRALLK